MEFWEHAIEYFGMSEMSIYPNRENVKSLLRRAMIEKFLMQKIFPESDSGLVKTMISSLEKSREDQFVELSRQMALKVRS